VETLSGRVAVVTGGAGGIGLGMARAFAEQGMSVVLVDVDGDRLDAAAAAVGEAGAPAVRAEVVDVRDAEAVAQLAARTAADLGGVHVLCNNAGVSTMGYQWQTPLDDWRWVVDVNLFGVVHGVHAFLPLLLEQDEAHVVNTASMAGLIPSAGSGPYNATKHAVVGLSRGLRAELAIRAPHVGVSVLCPGEIATDMADRIRTPPTPKYEARLEALRSHIAATGMDPLVVGRQVVAAIQARTFWILANGEPHFPLLERELDELRDAVT
jgi:NAD(P)-dependent dehydrogenase (short-subunit alcohol dehydrogenase family)